MFLPAAQAAVGDITTVAWNGAPGFSDPNKKANELYVHAAETINNISTEAKSYSEAYEYYKSARENIERILSKYPSSNLAVRLLSGETLISKYELG